GNLFTPQQVEENTLDPSYINIGRSVMKLGSTSLYGPLVAPYRNLWMFGFFFLHKTRKWVSDTTFDKIIIMILVQEHGRLITCVHQGMLRTATLHFIHHIMPFSLKQAYEKLKIGALLLFAHSNNHETFHYNLEQVLFDNHFCSTFLYSLCHHNAFNIGMPTITLVLSFVFATLTAITREHIIDEIAVLLRVNNDTFHYQELSVASLSMLGDCCIFYELFFSLLSIGGAAKIAPCSSDPFL
ncbi:hypothetical protein ACJX0J_019422, partial [Zea mays]